MDAEDNHKLAAEVEARFLRIEQLAMASRNGPLLEAIKKMWKASQDKEAPEEKRVALRYAAQFIRDNCLDKKMLKAAKERRLAAKKGFGCE